MKFIDLFAGLGGFHIALSKANLKCVFASEIDNDLQELYKSNYGISPSGDITKIHAEEIPQHDILCAGFPCQPFSLAGQKKGSKCPESGNLINDVIRIVRHHKPTAFILENVPNVLTIEDGSFWKHIKSSFSYLGYGVDRKIISPFNLGIPQNRKRLFIIGIKDNKELDGFEWPNFNNSNNNINSDYIKTWLDSKHGFKQLESPKKSLIKHWQKLLNNIKVSKMPSISILAPEFGANYPANFKGISLNQMKNYKGSYGQSLSNCNTWKEVYTKLPGYLKDRKKIPDWILQSWEFTRLLYNDNKIFLDQWKQDIPKEFNSWQILEWRGERKIFNMKNHFIQFRASGLRVMKNHYIPSLVAMTTTQVPIIGLGMRYLSRLEAAKLQGMENIRLPDKDIKAFKSLGNAVNAHVAYLIAKNLKHYINNH